MGGHALDVVQACERHGVKADFYIKTFHNHSYPTAPKPEQIKGPLNEYPGYWCSNPQETADFMKGVQKPWIAFKTMAAGAIPPRQAFRRAFGSGADFVLAGMFDFEIAEDVQIAQDAVATHRDRDALGGLRIGESITVADPEYRVPRLREKLRCFRVAKGDYGT